MNRLDLTLRLQPGTDADAKASSRRIDLLWVAPAVKQAVWRRDDYTCSACGFRARQYQEVAALGGNERDIERIVTVCQFCHQCIHLDAVTSMRSGVLIWLPEVDQATLNHFARMLYLAKARKGTMGHALRLIEVLMQRRSSARERLGSDDPADLVLELNQTPIQAAQRLAGEAYGLRLLPLDRRIIKIDGIEFNQFPHVLNYWRSDDGPLKGHPLAMELRALQSKLDADAKEEEERPGEDGAESTQATTAPSKSDSLEMPFASVVGQNLFEAAASLGRLSEAQPALRDAFRPALQNLALLASFLEQGEPAALPKMQPDEPDPFSGLEAFTIAVLQATADLFDELAKSVTYEPGDCKSLCRQADTLRDAAAQWQSGDGFPSLPGAE